MRNTDFWILGLVLLMAKKFQMHLCIKVAKNFPYLTWRTFSFEINEKKVACLIQDVVSPHCCDKRIAWRCTRSSLPKILFPDGISLKCVQKKSPMSAMSLFNVHSFILCIANSRYYFQFHYFRQLHGSHFCQKSVVDRLCSDTESDRTST